ncbi:ecto-ADP-ribosyltransferase 5-like isoform X2 [Melanotaenia boesemani]|uniref:ecto-ADP-ribosyltransferase 5-like isoform X2 n=1 Tax=Melanotaenia boesemani TaxID=1250792 RepID=UPI001C03E771|nr:ecto-ADP-ribosyltransferase 5-like isoform X2 [Melanotaenia boesemani]
MGKVAAWATVFIMFGASIGTAKQNIVSLDMAPNSVDDMYTVCKDKMEKKVKAEFILNERNGDKNFSLAWKAAEVNYNKKWSHRRGKKPSRTLGKEQIIAIYVYTLDKPKIYLEFNDAVRTQRFNYKTTFKYHTLHFFLTTALQTLNARNSQSERCLTGFRRVSSYFSEDMLNKEIRFGSFISSSMGEYPSPDKYGDQTCFEIYTCFGADISLYSKVGESERELLIPPYEIFKVTSMEKRSAQKQLPCDVVYKLKSTEKTLSNVDCGLF